NNNNNNNRNNRNTINIIKNNNSNDDNSDDNNSSISINNNRNNNNILSRTNLEDQWQKILLKQALNFPPECYYKHPSQSLIQWILNVETHRKLKNYIPEEILKDQILTKLVVGRAGQILKYADITNLNTLTDV